MKILIVMSGGFDTYGPSIHLYKALIEDLLSYGYIVHLIESHTTGNDPDVPLSFSKNPNFSYETVNAGIARKRAFVKRYLIGFLYTIRCGKVLKRAKKKFDITLVQSCVWAPFMIPLVKKKTQSIVVWNIQDMFPGASIANGVLKNRFLMRFFYKLHKRAYRKADHITVISEDMRRKVIEQDYNPNHITVINDWFDASTVKEIAWKNNLFAKKYAMDADKFYVQYAGTMGFNFDYKVILNVASILRNQTDIVFQMVGFGSQLDNFKNEVKKKKLTNVCFLPLQEQNMVSSVYSSCDVCIIPLPYGVIGNSVPSKMALLMACKRPVITTSDEGSDYLNMVNSNGFGLGFSTKDYKKVAESILKLKNNPSLLKKMGQKGYQFGHIIYSRSYNTQKYITLFQQLTANNSQNKANE